MAVTLLALSNGRVSLEFDPSDIPRVKAAIEAGFADARKEIHPTMTEYHFGGCSFAFQNEWDDPCLISGSDAGDEVLRVLYADLAKRL